MEVRKRLKRPVPISCLLDDALKRLDLEVKLKQHQVFALWNEVVGPKIVSHAQPTSIRGGRLFVAVEDSMWLHQLDFLKHQILSDLNSRLGKTALCDIVLRVGEVKPLLPAPGEIQWSSPHLQRALGPQQQEEARRILSPIKDQGCQEVLQRILLHHFCRNKYSQESNNSLKK